MPAFSFDYISLSLLFCSSITEHIEGYLDFLFLCLTVKMFETSYLCGARKGEKKRGNNIFVYAIIIFETLNYSRV